MLKNRSWELALVLGSLLFVLFAGVRATAIPCNGKQLQLGHCGTEDICEGRGQADCTATLSKYYPDDEVPIGCQNGAEDDYCKSTSAQGSICTCKWNCKWNMDTGMCEKDTAYKLGGVQVCSRLDKKYSTLTCTVPSGG